MSGMLYIVPTPIGNLKDMTYRAVDTLNNVDEILCEDTRHSMILLNAYNIKKPLLSYHKFNIKRMQEIIITKLEEGKNLALISDAGMPCISDPGSELVGELIKRKINFSVLPGATAFVNAIIMSGFSSSPFVFLGFLPEKNRDKNGLIERVQKIQASLVFYISPHSIGDDIKYLYSKLGKRKIAIVKELTKINERVIFSDLEIGLTEEARGEYIIIVEGASDDKKFLALSIDEHVNVYIEMGMTKNDAIKQVAKEREVQKNDIYKVVHIEKK